MNYIEEHAAFIDWLETNPLEASAQTLWFHLMVIANKSGYPEWFAVANPLLQAKVGLSENSLIKHRNVLVQKGRIEYRSQGKKQAGKYRIVPFTSNSEVIQVVTRGANRGVTEGVKGSALRSLSSSDLTTTTTMRENEPRSLTEAYADVFGGGTIPPIFARFFMPILQQYGERYAIELMLESGESGSKPSLRHIESIHESWKERGVRSREESRASKTLPFKPKNKQQSDLDELERLAEEERRREQAASH